MKITKLQTLSRSNIEVFIQRRCVLHAKCQQWTEKSADQRDRNHRAPSHSQSAHNATLLSITHCTFASACRIIDVSPIPPEVVDSRPLGCGDRGVASGSAPVPPAAPACHLVRPPRRRRPNKETVVLLRTHATTDEYRDEKVKKILSNEGDQE